MKLSRIDQEILTALKNKGECSVHDLVTETGLIYANLSRRLQVLKRHNIIRNQIIFNKRIYRINLRMKSNTVFLKVACPKCNAQKSVHDYSIYVSCSNPSCKTKGGNRTRFFISRNRILKYQDIIREGN